MLREKYGFDVPSWVESLNCTNPPRQLISLAEKDVDSALKDIARIVLKAVLFHRGKIGPEEALEYALNARVFAMAPSEGTERKLFKVCYELNNGAVRVVKLEPC